MTRTRARLLILTGLAIALLAVPSTAHARAILISASPYPAQTLDRPPKEVRLTFSTALDPASFTLTVVDAVGVHVDNSDAHLLASDQATLVVSLPPLDEGLYTVTYTITDLASQTTTSDSYQFALNFPTPQIRLVSPPDGAGFEENSAVKIEVDTGNFDLVEWKHAWRLYLDGNPIATTRQPTYYLRELDEGVHELRVILVAPDGVELNNTRSTTYIAIGQPDPLARQIAVAATAPPDPGLTLSTNEAILLAIIAAVCLGAGILLGRHSTPEAA